MELLQRTLWTLSIVSCRGCRGPGVDFGDFSRFFMNFRRENCFFQSLRTYIDAEFHGESISDGFRAIRQRKVCQKSKKPEKNRQTRFSGQPSLSIIPGCHCRYTLQGRGAKLELLRSSGSGAVHCKVHHNLSFVTSVSP